MKIVQLVPDLNLAGAQTMCQYLSEKLKDDNNIDIKICCLYSCDNSITKRLKEKGIELVFLDKKKGLDVSIIWKLKSFLEKEKPEVIHTHRYVLEYLLPARFLSSYKDFKIVHTIHNLADKDVGKTLLKLQKRWFKYPYIYPVAISDIVRKSISKVYEIKEEAIPVIYNGVTLESFTPKKYERLNKKLIHIGRFQDAKNHKGIIDIFKDIHRQDKKEELIFLGDGELFEEIKAYTKQQGLEGNVVFKGSVSNVDEELKNADIFILLSKFEGMPMTIIEAMATGLPIIAYPVGGIPEMIEDGVNGYLPKTNVDAQKCILSLINDKETIKKMGLRSQELSKKFSSERMADSYKELYKKISE